MLAGSRLEHRLQRQRGAGARELASVQFGFVFGDMAQPKALPIAEIEGECNDDAPRLTKRLRLDDPRRVKSFDDEDCARKRKTVDEGYSDRSVVEERSQDTDHAGKEASSIHPGLVDQRKENSSTTQTRDANHEIAPAHKSVVKRARKPRVREAKEKEEADKACVHHVESEVSNRVKRARRPKEDRSHPDAVNSHSSALVNHDDTGKKAPPVNQGPMKPEGDDADVDQPCISENEAGLGRPGRRKKPIIEETCEKANKMLPASSAKRKAALKQKCASRKTISKRETTRKRPNTRRKLATSEVSKDLSPSRAALIHESEIEQGGSLLDLDAEFEGAGFGRAGESPKESRVVSMPKAPRLTTKRNGTSSITNAKASAESAPADGCTLDDDLQGTKRPQTGRVKEQAKHPIGASVDTQKDRALLARDSAPMAKPAKQKRTARKPPTPAIEQAKKSQEEKSEVATPASHDFEKRVEPTTVPQAEGRKDHRESSRMLPIQSEAALTVGRDVEHEEMALAPSKGGKRTATKSRYKTHKMAVAQSPIEPDTQGRGPIAASPPSVSRAAKNTTEETKTDQGALQTVDLVTKDQVPPSEPLQTRKKNVKPTDHESRETLEAVPTVDEGTQRQNSLSSPRKRKTAIKHHEQSTEKKAEAPPAIDNDTHEQDSQPRASKKHKRSTKHTKHASQQPSKPPPPINNSKQESDPPPTTSSSRAKPTPKHPSKEAQDTPTQQHPKHNARPETTEARARPKITKPRLNPKNPRRPLTERSNNARTSARLSKPLNFGAEEHDESDLGNILTRFGGVKVPETLVAKGRDRRLRFRM